MSIVRQGRAHCWFSANQNSQQQFLPYSHCVFAFSLPLPCKKLKQYLGVLLLSFSIPDVILIKSGVSFHVLDSFCSCCCWRIPLPEPTLFSCFKPTVFYHCGKNICSHSLTVLLLNLGLELFWIPARGFCREGQTIMPLVH